MPYGFNAQPSANMPTSQEGWFASLSPDQQAWIQQNFRPAQPQPQGGNQMYYPQPPQNTTYPPSNPVPQQVEPVRQSVIPGRAVNSPEDIRPNEIPMDGTLCYFPTRDFSRIYVKAWDSDGQLKTFIFENAQVPVPDTPKEDPTDKVLKRLDEIEELINGRFQNQKSAPKVKEEKA